jgi:enoyl-CoA hydratase/carnithine racemase
MNNDLVLSSLDGPIARLTLNDPDRANVLSIEMMDALEAALAAAAAEEAVRVIVLGAAGKVFCAGHDLGEVRDAAGTAAAEALFARCSRLMLSIVECRVPVIARVQGAAVAAGCQLVASCDLAYAAQKARFAVSGINLGLFCSTPGVALARAVPRKAAAQMLLTGEFIDAPRAVALGLINAAAPAEGLDALIDAVAEAIADKPPEAIALGKATLRRQVEAPLAEAYDIASRAMAQNLGFTSARDGIEGFLKR